MYVPIIFVSHCDLVCDKKWTELDAPHHRAHAMRMLDGLEVTAREKRLKVARAILYMVQGQSFIAPMDSVSFQNDQIKHICCVNVEQNC